MPAEVFISYKREERSKAHSIAKALIAYGYEVWWDVELLPGDKFADEIRSVLEKAKAAIVLWSKDAVRSDFVRAEASLALKLGILIPVTLDDCELPLPFGGHHTLDLSMWSGKYKDKLLDPVVAAVEKKVGRPSPVQEKPKNVELALDHLRVEVDYWRSVSEKESQTIEDYQAYLSKYGEHSIFADLAQLRIEKLKKEIKYPSPGKLVVGATVFIVIMIGVYINPFKVFQHNNNISQQADDITQIKNSPIKSQYWQFTPGLPKKISVCWEEDPKYFPQESFWVKDAIEKSWALHSELEFVGWKQCEENSRGVRIGVEDYFPHAKSIGKKLDGMKNGIVLNLTFEKHLPECRKTLETCIRATAVHEFGHVLGFPHEHIHPDAPDDCVILPIAGEEYPTSLLSTPYDPDSVMNYCNGVFANHGVLSHYDKIKLRSVYGE